MAEDTLPLLLDLVRQAIRRRHYTIRTEEAFVNWIRRFILFHQKRIPSQMGVAEIEAFLTNLAVNQHVAASTQNQALSAIIFLYKEVINLELEARLQAQRAKSPQHLPVALSQEETRCLLEQIDGIHLLMTRFLHGSALRLMKCLRLRVKDVDIHDRSGAVYLPNALERKYPNSALWL